jgi:subtilisin family serine protease
MLTISQAISWASKEWKADIILMSFGYMEEQQCISRAIRRALYERDDSILFFAAASNYGANDKEMFPARHESVISIRGTNSNGNFEDFNPPRNQNEETVLGTLGLDVPSAWLSDHDDEVYKSGTSIAAAVAAGIAGALLGYVNGKSKESAFQDLNKKLRRRHGMQALFRALASPTLKERCLYLAPWKLMGHSDETRWAIVVAALSDIS